jgi:hypothetical protein
VHQPAAEQREENRADFDEHCGGARVDVTFAPAERDHIQPEPEQPRAQNSGPRCPGRPAITAEQPHHAEGEWGREQAAPARAHPARNARPPALRIATKAEAHSTVTAAAATGPTASSRAVYGNVL